MIKILLLVLLVLALLLLAGGYIIFYLAFCRFPKDPALRHPRRLQPYAPLIDRGMDWFISQKPQIIRLQAFDGTALVGEFLPHPEPRGTILMFHGFRGHAHYEFSGIFARYYQMGYSLLTVHQRAHGLSGGSYITLGVKERRDCLNWCQYLSDRFGPEHDIFLDGISMGAATVLMATELPLPASVRGVIADSGFTSPEQELRYLCRRHHLPARPLLDVTELFCRLFAGFSMSETSTLTAMPQCRLPVLFVHGEADTLVPCAFSRAAYEACRGPKQLLTVEGAEHGMGYLLEPDALEQVLQQFLTAYGSHREGLTDAEDDLSPLAEE